MAVPIIRGNSLYSLIANSLSWDGSEIYSAGLGGHLVSIRGQAENDFLVSTYGTTYSQFNLNYWTGLNDSVQEGVLQWSDGSSVVFANFDAYNDPANLSSSRNASNVLAPFV